MSDEHIHELRVKGYGPLKDVDVRLSPLHAFIGPNDSGKSTILWAVRTLVLLASGKFHWNGDDWDEPFNPRLSWAQPLLLQAGFADRLGFRISSDGPGRHGVHRISEKAYEVTQNAEPAIRGGQRVPHELGVLAKPPSEPEAVAQKVAALARRLSGARFTRFDPYALRRPSGLIPQGRAPFLSDDRGSGLPGVYDAILNREVETFLEIERGFKQLFPTVERLRLKNVSESTKALEVKLVTGEVVPAELMSDGMLLYLAFAAIPHIEPTSVLLVEEPENGLHPARIADVMRVLREVSKSTQVLVATHSPLVVNELEPHEVSVVTREREAGTRVTPIAETPGFDERSKVYALGELWVSYADGVAEAPLLGGSGRVP